MGKISSITTGKLDANAMKENGIYDFYTSGIKKYKTNTFSFEGPAITIAGNGATVGYLHSADGKFDAYQRTYVLNNLKVNRDLLLKIISKYLPRKIKSESRTGNIPYIVMDMLTELKIKIPYNVNEQIKLSKLLNSIDKLIDANERGPNRLPNATYNIYLRLKYETSNFT